MLLAVRFSHLRIGHLLQSNVETKGGILLVPSGGRITPMLLHWLRNFAALYGIKEPILVANPAEATGRDSSDTQWMLRNPSPPSPPNRPTFQNTP